MKVHLYHRDGTVEDYETPGNHAPPILVRPNHVVFVSVNSSTMSELGPRETALGIQPQEKR